MRRNDGNEEALQNAEYHIEGAIRSTPTARTPTPVPTLGPSPVLVTELPAGFRLILTGDVVGRILTVGLVAFVLLRIPSGEV